MQLYYVPRTRAVRPRWLLEELGVPYELVRLDRSKDENHSPQYLQVHPLGHVPALVDGEVRLMESAAICLYLADKYPEKKLAPAVGTTARAEYYQWIAYAMATLEPPVATVYYNTTGYPEARRNPALVEPAKARFLEVATVLQRHVAGRKWVAGDGFTAADVIVASVVDWADRNKLTGDVPGLMAYTRALIDRPASHRARAD